MFPSPSCAGIPRSAASCICLRSGATDKTRAALVQIADIFRAKTVDVASDSLIFEIAGDEEKLKAFYSNMKKYGVLEVARTGVTAMARGRLDNDI